MAHFALRQSSGASLGSSLFANGVLVPEVLPAAHGPPGLGPHQLAELAAAQHADAVRLAVITNTTGEEGFEAGKQAHGAQRHGGAHGGAGLGDEEASAGPEDAVDFR